MKLTNLRICSQENPLGIQGAPWFSWVLTSKKQNVVQEAFSITVTDESGAVVWEKAEHTRQSAFVICDAPLRSRTKYDVSVTVTDNHGESDTICGHFEAALDKNDWQAQWVRSTLPVFPAEKGFGLQPPATMFRKSFACCGDVQSARLYCTCHGIYVPYLNGETFGDRLFAPEHTTYGKVLCYQTYDVTALLRKGGNTLSMYVGDGWYLGVKTTPRIENYDRRHAVLFQIEITYADGTRELVCSGDDVQCAYGPVVCSDLFAGEKYDARIQFENWENAEPTDYGFDNLVAQQDGGVTRIEEIPVHQVIQTPKGETILDFGKVLAGRIRMRVWEKAGAEITLQHTEVLDREGNFFQSAQMPDGGVEQQDVYTCDGGEGVYEPLFTYHGFRYVKVEGLEKVRPADFTAIVLSSQKEFAGSFACSDDRLNKLYRNIQNSQQSNLLSIPTDCPQREKAGWTGDIAIYGKTALLNADLTAFLNRWLLSVRADQGENGAVPIVVPYDGGYPMSELFFGPMYQEPGTIGSAGWGDCCIEVPYAMYQVTGDTQVIRDNLDVMEKWCGYILNRCKLGSDPWLWTRGYQQGDWLVPSLSKETAEDPITGPLKQMEFTAQYAAPLYGWRCFARMAEMLAAIGSAKAEDYAAIADHMKAAIGENLFDADGRMPTDLMGAYVLAIAFDLVPEQHRAFAANRLVTLLHENGGCLDTGFLSTPYLLDALCRIGRQDLAFDTLYQNKCPGWLYEVENGATAVWESWGNYEENGQPKAISFNHYALGCVDEWIFRKINGITALEPGFRHFRIQPIPERLSWAERRFQSEYGEIFVRWETKDGQFCLTCRIPCNTAAEIILPNGECHTVGSGSYRYTRSCS